MIKIKTIPSNEQLLSIAENIEMELVDVKRDNMYIVFEVDRDTLRKIDEEFFYKNNKGSGVFKPSDEVEVIINGVKFKFIDNLNGN